MSFPNWNSDPSFNKITSTYFKDLIDLSGNFIIRNGTIKSPANTIEFDDTLSVINIPNTLKATQLKTSYASVEYTVGLELSTLKPIVNATALKCSNITYDASLNKTTVSNLLEFTGTLNAFSLADFNNSITNSLSLTSPAQTQINNLQTSITTLNTNTTGITYTSGTSTTNIPKIIFTGTLNNVSAVTFSYLSNVTGDIAYSITNLQTQIDGINAVSLSANNTWTGSNIFNETLRLNNNLRLQGALLVDNGGTTITNATLRNLQYLANVTSDINTSISNLNTKTTNISYGAFNTTTFSGNLSFPLASINSTSISNSTFLALSGNQSAGGQKTWNSLAIFNNNIRLDTGSLILNTNTLTLTNANLQKIQYISDVTGAVGANLTSLQTQISNFTGVSLSANNVFTGSNSFNGNLNTTTFNSSVQINNGFGALYNNAVQFVFYPTQTTFSNGSAGENVFEFTANNTDRGITFQGGKGSDGRSLFGLYYLSGSFANPTNRLPILYGRDTGTQSTNVLTIASGTLATTNMTFSGTLNTISTTIFGYLSGLTENIKTSLDSLSSRASTLETKNTGISYSGTTTTIANTLATATLTFSGTLNNISTTTYGYLSNLSGNIQDQLNSLSTRIATVEIVGTIIMSPLNDLQTTTSNKYLMCNGQAVSRTTYSALFDKFGELFGAGNGSTTFNLPNYNGMFLRGMGNQIINGVNYGNYNSTYAPDQDSIQNHTHSGQSGSFLGTVNITVAPSYNSGSGASPNAYTFSNTGQMATGRINDFETKPVSIGIYYYVRT